MDSHPSICPGPVEIFNYEYVWQELRLQRRVTERKATAELSTQQAASADSDSRITPARSALLRQRAAKVHIRGWAQCGPFESPAA